MAINLIPPQLKAEKAIRKRNFYISIVFAFALILLVIISALVYLENFRLKNDLNDVKAQISQREGAMVKYLDLQKKIDDANKKLVLLKSINSDRYLWSVIIRDLAASTPSVVSIKSLNIGSDDQKIQLTGMAETRRDIAKFKEKLEESKYFKNVIFSSSSLNSGSNDYSFSLSAEIEGTGNE